MISLLQSCGSSNPPYKVELDEYAIPQFKYGRPPGWMEWRREFGTSYSSGLAKKVSYARIRALRSGNFRHNGKGIRIGVFDADQNRRFNDVGVDYVTISYFASDTMPVYECVASVPMTEMPFVVGIDSNFYQVDSIEADGSSLWIREAGAEISPIAYYPTKLPNYSVETIDGDTVLLRDFLVKGKYLYVECWSTWFQAAIDGLPEVKAAQSRFSDDLAVVQLVMNEADYGRVRGHMKRYDLQWPQAIFTNELGALLMQNSIPYGILFAPDGTIVKMGIGPGELEPFLASVL